MVKEALKEVRVQFPFDNGHELTEMVLDIIEWGKHPRTSFRNIYWFLLLNWSDVE